MEGLQHCVEREIGELTFKGPDGLYRHARFLSSDIGGCNYRMPIPLKTPVGLKIASSVGDVVDQTGAQVTKKDEHGMALTDERSLPSRVMGPWERALRWPAKRGFV